MLTLIIVGILFFGLLGWIMLRGKGEWQDDTTTSYNGNDRGNYHW